MAKDILERITQTTDDGQLQLKVNRLRMMCESQWTYISDYSGMDCPREAVRLLFQALSLRFTDWSLKDPIYLRSCDNDPACIRILQSISTTLDEGGACVFGDINDRVRDIDRQMLDAMEPDQKATTEEKAQARKEQLAYLRKAKDEIFTPESTSFCSVHNQQCLCFKNAKLPGKTLKISFAGTCCQGWAP